MKVKLIDYTADALALLLYTKNTRLQGGESSLFAIRQWPEHKKLEHLAYMKDTIKSSWEFVNYTFEISGVTRAFTHQLVRTRNGRYAQESMRTVDVRNNPVKVPTVDDKDFQADIDAMFGCIVSDYADLIDRGMPVQDARGILPTNATTSIIAQFSLRTLHEMALVRLCTRTQGEYQDVFRAMKAAVCKVHPWADDFIQVQCAWNGICAFPRYKECPIQRYTHNAELTHDKVVNDCRWASDNLRHEATPVVKDGTTM